MQRNNPKATLPRDNCEDGDSPWGTPDPQIMLRTLYWSAKYGVQACPPLWAYSRPPASPHFSSLTHLLWGGPSKVTERNPADTLPVSFEETLSTSLSSQGEVPACKGKGNPPAAGRCTPGWESVWGFTLFIEVWWGTTAFIPLPCCTSSSWDSRQPHPSVAEVLLLSTFHSLQGGAATAELPVLQP